MESDCLFCTFVKSGEKDLQKVYEDDEVVVILDDHPIAVGHSLVILKDHFRDLTCVPPEMAARLGACVARAAKALKEACGAAAVYVASVGELVRHVHFHLIPRYERDATGFCHFVSPRGRLTDPEPLAAKIRDRLAVMQAGVSDERCQQLRFTRGKRDGEEGLSPSEASPKYLEGYRVGRQTRLEAARQKL